MKIGPFQGLYDRDNDRMVPPHYLRRADNIDFEGHAVRRRRGFSASDDVSQGVSKLFDLSSTSVADVVNTSLIALTDDDRLRNLTSGSLVSSDDITNFSAATYLHRAFIAAREGASYYNIGHYDGEDFIEAGFDTSSVGLTVVTSQSQSGRVPKGNYHVGMVLETTTGHFSNPVGLQDYASSSSPGSLIRVTEETPRTIRYSANWATLPINIAKIHFISTAIIADDAIEYPHDSFSYYFIPDAILTRAANTFPATIDLSYFPPNLFSIADYLFEQHDTLDGADGVSTYNNRLVLWGGETLPEKSIVRISRPNEPESFNRLNGFLTIAPEVDAPITSVFDFRGILYIVKENSTYAVTDNGATPATWPVVVVDKGLGARSGEVSSIRSSQGTNLDYVLINTGAGLSKFDGTYKRPELSFNVENEWGRAKAVVRDPEKKKIYVLIDDNIMVGDYDNGITRTRWSKWTITGKELNHIIIDHDGNLLVAASDGMYEFDDESVENISCVLETGSIPQGSMVAQHFGDILVERVSGSLAVATIGQMTGDQSPINVPEGNTSYRVRQVIIDNSISVRLSSSGDFELNSFDIDIKNKWGVPLSG